MNVVFYLSAIVAVASTLLAITSSNAVHGLLYLVVSLLAVALIFFVLGAPFVAALEVIIYAGAIMVLFIFVIMVLNLGGDQVRQEKEWLNGSMWIGPAILCLMLIAELAYTLVGKSSPPVTGTPVTPQQVGVALFGPYLLGVELASMLLLSGLVGAYHLGRRTQAKEQPTLQAEERETEGGDGHRREVIPAPAPASPGQVGGVRVH